MEYCKKLNGHSQTIRSTVTCPHSLGLSDDEKECPFLTTSDENMLGLVSKDTAAQCEGAIKREKEKAYR